MSKAKKERRHPPYFHPFLSDPPPLTGPPSGARSDKKKY